MKNKIAVLLSIVLVVSSFCSNVLAVTTDYTSPIESTEITGDYKEGEAIVLYKQSSLSASSLEYKLAEDIDIVDTFDFEKENAMGFEASAVSMYEQSTLVSVVKSDKYTTAEIIDILEDKSNVLVVEPNYAVYPRDVVASGPEVDTETTSETPTEVVTENTVEVTTIIAVGYIEDCNPPAPNYNSKLWGFENDAMGINEVRAENSDMPLAENVVAVLDTGVDYTHEDLVDSMWHNPLPKDILPGEYGYDYNEGDDDPMPMINDPHGTHVAGTIAAQNNGYGIDGVSPNTKIMALRIFGRTPCYTDIQLKAFRYVLTAAENGVNIVAVNNSWGAVYNSQIFKYCVNQLYARGIITTVAAGNESDNNDMAPHTLGNTDSEGIIVVNATSCGNTDVSYSNWGRNTTHVWAPGRGIVSTVLAPVYNNYLKEEATQYIDFEDSSQQVIKVIDDADYGLSIAKIPYNDSNALKIENVIEANGNSLLIPIGKKKDLPQKITASFDISSDFDYLDAGDISMGFATLNVGLSEIKDNKITNEELEDLCLLGNYAKYIGGDITSVGATKYADISALEDEAEVYLAIEVSLLYENETPGVMYIDNISIGDPAKAQKYDDMEGTSMACPNLTGSIAYMRSLYPDMSATEVKARVVGGCIKTYNLEDTCVGDGYFNLKKALNNPNPYISDVTYGDNTMTIQGYFFGDTNNSVTLDGVPMEVLSWTDNAIVVSLTEFSTTVEDLIVTGTNGTGRKTIRTSQAEAISLEHIADINSINPEDYPEIDGGGFVIGDYLYQITNYQNAPIGKAETVLVKKNMADLSEPEEITNIIKENNDLVQAIFVGDTIYIGYTSRADSKKYIVGYNINSKKTAVIPIPVPSFLYTDGEDLFAVDTDIADKPFMKYNSSTSEWEQLDIPNYSENSTIRYATVVNNELIAMVEEYDENGGNVIRICRYKDGSWSTGEAGNIQSSPSIKVSSFELIGNLVYMVGVVSDELDTIARYDLEKEQWVNTGYKFIEYPFGDTVSMVTYNNELHIIARNAQTNKYGIYKLPNSDEVKGDVDGDGNISATDSALILQHILNPEAVGFSASQIRTADVNGDGSVNATDSAILLQKALVATFVINN